jgi:sulfide:quinone oxidoreductase
LYELALMTAERAAGMGMDDVSLTIVTPEPAPLAGFGRQVSDAVTGLLQERQIDVYMSSTALVPKAQQLLIQPPGAELHADRMIAMPRISGPSIRGIADAGAHGFIPIDKHCAVPGTGGRVFAAGDATAFPIKHGGLGAQQADTAAAGIARLAGAEVEAASYHPVLHGVLLTGKDPLYLTARVVGGRGFESEVSTEPTWEAADKVTAEELGPYLAGSSLGA